MRAEYDEDIGKNSFFTAISQRHENFFDRAASERWTVCVPCSRINLQYQLADDDFANHILMFSTEDESKEKLQTIHGKLATIKNNTVTVTDDLKNVNIQAKILFEETFYTKGGKNFFQLLCLDNYLVDLTGDSGSPSLLTLQSVRECLEFLTREIENKQTISKMDRDIYKWNRKHCNLEQEPVTSMKELVTSLYEKILKTLSTDYSVKSKTQDKQFMEHFTISLESYILHKLYANVIKGISFQLEKDDAHLNKNLRNLSHIPLRSLHSNPGFKTTVPRAVWEISQLDQFTTPLDKLNCVKRCITILIDPKTMLIRATVDADDSTDDHNKNNVDSSRFVLDDLIPILVFVLLKTTTSNWFSHLTFMKEFRLSAKNRVSKNDDFSFYCASLEAAIECVRSGVLNCTSQEAFLGQDNPSNTLPTQSSSHCTKFFKCAKTGDVETLKQLLKDSAIPPAMTSNCHPLCSCDRCEQEQRNTFLNVHTKDDNGNTALHMAAAHGNGHVIDFLVNCGAKVDATNYGGQTPLHLACQRGHQNAVLLLLDNKAAQSVADHGGNTALHLCTLNGHENCVKAMIVCDEHRQHSRVNINATNNFGDSALHLAARWGYSKIVKFLVKNGAKTDTSNRRQETPLDCTQNLRVQRILEKAVEDDQYRRNDGFVHIEVNKMFPKRHNSVFAFPTQVAFRIPGFSSYSPLLSQSTKVDALMKAVESGDINLVCYYLNIKCDYTADDVTDSLCHPLCQCDKCKALLKTPNDHRENAYRPMLSIGCQNQQGWQPLHVAVAHRQHLLMKLLLQNDANPNNRTKDTGSTPLHLASKNSDTTATEILLSHGSSVDLVDFTGKSALSLALQEGHSNIVAILMKTGFPSDHRDNF